ncbi:MAG: DNA replication/repair protein RecF [Rhizobiaceae bacterium]|nr:DNA replication/repair protein RecF [Rhizobiaceae bacterium]
MTEAAAAARTARRARPVNIGRLTLTDFRNYRSLSLDLDPGRIVLTGENGAGKTNLLEAISFLSPGRGLRRAVYADVARAGAADGFAVHARIDGDVQTQIGTGTMALGNAQDSGRKVRIDGSTTTAEAMLEHLRVIWLTPAMDALFTGPAGDRRRFLDRLVLALDPAQGVRMLDYEKAMRGRNRLLAEESRDWPWFDAIEAQMAETGIAIAAARAELVGLLAGMTARLPRNGPFPTATLALEGRLEAAVGGRAAVDVEEEFRALLAGGRERDRAAGRTLEGPHLSDLVVRHAPKDMPAELCSTGEQKALLIGIVLAHARLVGEMTGLTPVLLLDEIAAHLDAGRRAALFDILDDLGCQAFMTGTEASLFSAIAGKAQFLTVSDGSVRPTG